MKKLRLAALALATAFSITACGGDDVKVIEKEQAVSETTENADKNTVETTATKESNEESSTTAGYAYLAEGPSGSIEVTPDMDMSVVLEALGEETTYFEAASCAFEGLDKVYTYDHFEIDTYPDGDTDKISAIILLDDLTTTQEGVYIGQSKADMESAYGTDYEKNSNSYTYTKDGAHLEFILEGETIISISYNSAVLDEE